MSYCRFATADVYVYRTQHGYQCGGCSIINDIPKGGAVLYRPWRCETPQEMIAHLREHRKRGDHVPEHVFDRLKADAAHSP